MSLLLYDTSPAATKGLDAACVSGVLLDHGRDQLILVHGCAPDGDGSFAHAPVSAAVEHIAKSRTAAATLNYKFECVRVAQESVSAAVTPAPTPGDQPRGGRPKGKAHAAPVEETLEPSPRETAEEARTLTATAIAAYATERCAHHRCRSAVVGVGAGTPQGKAGLPLGSVAAAVVEAHLSSQGGCGCSAPLSADHDASVFEGDKAHELQHFTAGRRSLFVAKAAGSTVRATSQLRVMLVATPRTDPAALATLLVRLPRPVTRGDQVGVTVITNDGAAAGPPSPEAVAFAAECRAALIAAGVPDTEAEDVEATAEDGVSVAPAAVRVPLVTFLALEPTAAHPTPTISDVAPQCVKQVGQIKVDFLAVPPPAADPAFQWPFVKAALAAAKPHVLLL